MTKELARQKAAQAWCKDTTSHVGMIPELAEAFAEILQEATKATATRCVEICNQPLVNSPYIAAAIKKEFDLE